MAAVAGRLSQEHHYLIFFTARHYIPDASRCIPPAGMTRECTARGGNSERREVGRRTKGCGRLLAEQKAVDCAGSWVSSRQHLGVGLQQPRSAEELDGRRVSLWR